MSRVQQTSTATASKIEDASRPLRVQPCDGADQCVPHIAWMTIILCHMVLITLNNCCAKWYRLRRHECIKRSLQLQAMIDAAPRCHKHFAISTVVCTASKLSMLLERCHLIKIHMKICHVQHKVPIWLLKRIICTSVPAASTMCNPWSQQLAFTATLSAPRTLC